MIQSQMAFRAMVRCQVEGDCAMRFECMLSPHPGPLPWGEGESAPPLGTTQRGVCPTNLRNNRTCRRLFPLPVGEGQGEGDQGCRSIQRLGPFPKLSNYPSPPAEPKVSQDDYVILLRHRHSTTPLLH